MSKTIFKAYSSSLLGIFSGLLTQLVFIRALSSAVPHNDFALYAFVFQIIAYMNILQLGLDFATSREIAIKLGKDDYAGANQSYLFIRRFNNKLCLGGFAIVILIAALFYNGIGISINFNYLMAAKLILFFGVSFFLNFLSNPYIVALIGNNRQSVVNINNVLITISSTVTAFILLKNTSLGVYSMPLSLVVFNSLNFLLLRSKAIRYCKEWIVNNKSVSIPKDYNKSILRFSIFTTIGGFAWTIEATSDVFILNGAGLLSMVGFYVLWWRFPQMLFDLATRLTTSSLPSLNTAFGKSDDDAKLIFNRLIILVGGIGFCVYICIASWLPAFINLWVGPQFFIEDMKLVSYFMGLLVYSRIIGNCFGMFTITLGKVNYATTLSWIQAIVKVAIALILVRQFGLKGLFIGSIAGSLIQVGGSAILLFKRKLLRPDVALLVLIGYVTPLILLLFHLHDKVSLFKFLYASSATLICAVLSWILYVQIISLNEKLNFSLLTKTLLTKFKRIKPAD